MIKHLSFNFKQSSNFRTQGGHCSRRFRFIDFFRFFQGLPGRVIRIEYDPYRNVRLMLILYINGLFSYLVAPANIIIGQVIYSSNPNFLTPGSSVLLLYVPIGGFIFNVEWRPGLGASFLRSAGSIGKLIQKCDTFVVIQKRNGLRITVSAFCKCVLGINSNAFIKLILRKNAGQVRRLGVRPVVRGVARNPVDHPNGGRTSGGKVFKSVWGKLCKHIKTSSTFCRQNNKYIVSV